MRKIITVALVTLLILAIIPATFPIVLTASAATPAYTEINGTLNGANYTIRFPSPMNSWNRILVVYCHGYSHTEPTRPLITVPDGTNNWANGTLSIGSAFAMSSYGAGGFCVQKGMNATYELTQYIVSTYKVAKVYLVGVSMGGEIALLLGEKYPKVYSGVMDIAGATNTTEMYTTGSQMVAMNDTELTTYLQGLTAPMPPYPFTLYPPPLSNQIQQYRTFMNQSLADMAAECGGTPSQVPQAYRNIDPLYHTNISIPVITVHGTSDAIVFYKRSQEYQAAVAAAGKSNLYRLYPVTGGQHADTAVQTEASNHMMELAGMALQQRPLLQATAFCNVTVLSGWTWWFFAQGVGGVGSLKYQWYEGASLLAGQTSMVLPVTKNAPGNYEFYCQVSDSEGTTITTNTISLTVIS
jgi:pimeloyl-ACP methyl ester carboxylesterase